MLEPPPLHSPKRRQYDLCEVEQVYKLMVELRLTNDHKLTELLEQLIDLAGSREFLPAIVSIRSLFMEVKYKREGSGYIVPLKMLQGITDSQPTSIFSMETEKSTDYYQYMMNRNSLEEHFRKMNGLREDAIAKAHP
jgi:hypothetical protein